ncbi:hypothetical protein Pla108_00610 [Botrimarina colliarenosi]|uniref:Uncharacterized protein n=1 Tax=Botrimarina colliarenosi TaxID=2528001 RepID=A0A5C6AIR1_9BACT|nr:hypothetical protein [Botrimarina colliarenosi]TWT99128.1 hypothetical protein Pla108_00610 [Botrimarina colliarenosi]
MPASPVWTATMAVVCSLIVATPTLAKSPRQLLPAGEARPLNGPLTRVSLADFVIAEPVSGAALRRAPWWSEVIGKPRVSSPSPLGAWLAFRLEEEESLASPGDAALPSGGFSLRVGRSDDPLLIDLMVEQDPPSTRLSSRITLTQFGPTPRLLTSLGDSW